MRHSNTSAISTRSTEQLRVNSVRQDKAKQEAAEADGQYTARQCIELFHLVFLRALVAKGDDKA